MYIVAISTGHSNLDPGAIASDGTKEFTLNKAIVDKIFAINGPDLVPIFLWQSDLTCEDLPAGKQLICNISSINASSADLCIEIHHNACADPAVRGCMVLYWDTSDSARRLAESISDALYMIPRHGFDAFKHYWRNKQSAMYQGYGATKTIQHLRRRLAFLGKTYRTAALVEVAYLSNVDDLEFAKTHQLEIAMGIRAGVVSYLKN